MAVLGLRFCARAFSSCGKRGPLFIAVRGPLTIAASPVEEHRLQTRRLSNCGPRAQLLRSMWDPPRPGLKPMSPALAGRLSTTAPPGKPYTSVFSESMRVSPLQPQRILWVNSMDNLRHYNNKCTAVSSKFRMGFLLPYTQYMNMIYIYLFKVEGNTVSNGNSECLYIPYS